jgi:PRTRC genetic system protein C
MSQVAVRKFAYDGREFPDPDPAASAEQVKQMMSAFFPELATAEVKEHKDPKDANTTIYEFIRKTGTKGSKPWNR